MADKTLRNAMLQSVFHQRATPEDRKKEAARVSQKFTDRIPCVIEKAPFSHLPPLSKIKFLLPKGITSRSILPAISEKLSTSDLDGILLFVADALVVDDFRLSELFDLYQHEDGFLYLKYCLASEIQATYLQQFETAQCTSNTTVTATSTPTAAETSNIPRTTSLDESTILISTTPTKLVQVDNEVNIESSLVGSYIRVTKTDEAKASPSSFGSTQSNAVCSRGVLMTASTLSPLGTSYCGESECTSTTVHTLTNITDTINQPLGGTSGYSMESSLPRSGLIVKHEKHEGDAKQLHKDDTGTHHFSPPKLTLVRSPHKSSSSTKRCVGISPIHSNQSPPRNTPTKHKLPLSPRSPSSGCRQPGGVRNDVSDESTADDAASSATFEYDEEEESTTLDSVFEKFEKDATDGDDEKEVDDEFEEIFGNHTSWRNCSVNSLYSLTTGSSTEHNNSNGRDSVNSGGSSSLTGFVSPSESSQPHNNGNGTE